MTTSTTRCCLKTSSPIRTFFKVSEEEKKSFKSLKTSKVCWRKTKQPRKTSAAPPTQQSARRFLKLTQRSKQLLTKSQNVLHLMTALFRGCSWGFLRLTVHSEPRCSVPTCPVGHDLCSAAEGLHLPWKRLSIEQLMIFCRLITESVSHCFIIQKHVHSFGILNHLNSARLFYHPSGAHKLGLALFTTQKSKRKIIFYQLSVISRTKSK